MEETIPKPFVFVLMPFSAEFTDIYQLGIKAACKEAGAYCERVDEQIYDDESILERIHNQIAKADIIVAELTELNPNVFYEIGYARALNKRVIFLIQDAKKIPFDLQNYPHIVYEGRIISLKRELESKIRWCIENPQASLNSTDLTLQFLVNGVVIEENPEIPAEMLEYVDVSAGTYNATISLTIDIHNPTNKLLNPNSFDLAIVLPDVLKTQIGIYEYAKFRSGTQLPDGRRIYNMKELARLFPRGWDTLEIQLSTHGQRLVNDTEEIIIRLFTEVGPKDYPFTIRPQSTGITKH